MGFQEASYSVIEAEGVLSVCAVLSGQTERNVSVELSILQLPGTTAQGLVIIILYINSIAVGNNNESRSMYIYIQTKIRHKFIQMSASFGSCISTALFCISAVQIDILPASVIALQLFQPETANQLQCTNITIINDMVLEVDEVFFVVLSSNEPRIIVNPNTSVVTILDDDSMLILSLNSLMPLSVSYFTFLVCTSIQIQL